MKAAPDRKKIYPCNFPIKIIGKNGINLEGVIAEVMSEFVENIRELEFKKVTSRGGKYQSVTIHIIAKDLEHVENIYKALNAKEEIILVL
jgi:putative lipoic acid-binding regulatory protein